MLKDKNENKMMQKKKPISIHVNTSHTMIWIMRPGSLHKKKQSQSKLKTNKILKDEIQKKNNENKKEKNEDHI